MSRCATGLFHEKISDTVSVLRTPGAIATWRLGTFRAVAVGPVCTRCKLSNFDKARAYPVPARGSLPSSRIVRGCSARRTELFVKVVVEPEFLCCL